MTDHPTNLPLALTSLVGRERELEQLEPILLTNRLLTLTGSGGAGKTRLALELARRVLSEFEDGAWLVELAPLTDETLVPAVVAEALGLVDRSGSLIDTLAAYLQAHDLLLVLDNCEHLIGACAQLVEQLLQRCCLNLRILTTSREPLRIPGEAAWRVPSLSLPAVESPAANLSVVAQSEGCRVGQFGREHYYRSGPWTGGPRDARRGPVDCGLAAGLVRPQRSGATLAGGKHGDLPAD